MKAPDFSYEKPETLAEALRLLVDPEREASPLAGGQSLMPIMNFRMAQPNVLIDLNGIGELRGIAESEGAITVGAMTRYAELERSPIVARYAPLIGKALPFVAHPAVRNRGTIGGSVSLADPAAEMPALLLALNATITVQGAVGKRHIAADDFFVGTYETALEEGELVTAVCIPKAGPEGCFGFYELARRRGDYAMAGVAFGAEARDCLRTPRIAFFSLADCALRATAAEAALAGHSVADPDAVAAAVASLEGIEMSGDINGDAACKRQYAGVVLRRALAEV